MSVYPVREDTLLVKRNIGEQNLEGVAFLEIGIGNAEVSLEAAENGADVKAVDINSEAVKHARERFKEEDLDAEISKSNLFEEIKGEFDLIVFNPPYLKGPKGIGDEEMWRGGETGLEVTEEFLEEIGEYLNENGEAWIVLSSRTEYSRLVEKFGLVELDREKLWFETVLLLKFE